MGKRSDRREGKAERQARSQELRASAIPPRRRDERREKGRAREIAGDFQKRTPGVKTKFALHPSSASARRARNMFATVDGPAVHYTSQGLKSGEGGRRLPKEPHKTFVGMGPKGPEAHIHVVRRKLGVGRFGVQQGGREGRTQNVPVIAGRKGRVSRRSDYFWGNSPEADAESEREYSENPQIKRHREIQRLSRPTRDSATGTVTPATTVARARAAELRKDHEREREVSDPRGSTRHDFLKPAPEMGREALQKKLEIRRSTKTESFRIALSAFLVESY